MELNTTSISLPDYHLHTPLCRHAEGEPAAYRRHALEKGIPSICFTDHAPNPDGYDQQHRMGMEQFQTYTRMISAIQGQLPPPDVLLGIEADYYEGCEAHLSVWLAANDFDFVLGSIHYLDNWGFDNSDERHIWDSVDVKAAWASYFVLMERLVGSRLFDAVSHLDLPKKFGHRPRKMDLREMILPVLDKIALSGMGMEINTSGFRKPVGEAYPSEEILAWASERKIPLCFGSDAHLPSEVGYSFENALSIAKRAGYNSYFTIDKRKKAFHPLPDAQR